MSGHPTPHWCVQEKQGQHSRDDSFSQIAAQVHSSPSATAASQERSGLPCVGVDGFELERSHTARLPRKHMKESCVCLAAKNMEKGVLTAWRRVADGEMQPIFSPPPEILFKDLVLEVGLEKREEKQQQKNASWYSANALFPDVMLKSVCVSVSVIYVLFYIITCQFIPPGAGFWLLIYLYQCSIGFIVQWEEQLSTWPKLPHPAPPSPDHSHPRDCIDQLTFIIAAAIFIFTLPVPSSPSLRWERGRQRQKLDEKLRHHAILCSIKPLFFP